jgi:hypothetical protein
MIELSFSAIVFLETVNEAAGLLRFSIDRVIFEHHLLLHYSAAVISTMMVSVSSTFGLPIKSVLQSY